MHLDYRLLPKSNVEFATGLLLYQKAYYTHLIFLPVLQEEMKIPRERVFSFYTYALNHSPNSFIFIDKIYVWSLQFFFYSQLMHTDALDYYGFICSVYGEVLVSKYSNHSLMLLKHAGRTKRRYWASGKFTEDASKSITNKTYDTRQ